MVDIVKTGVSHIINRYFNFFKLPHFVPPKWFKKFKWNLKKFVKADYDLQDLQPLKDEEIENFNIDNIIDSISNQNDFLSDYDSKLKTLLNEIKTNTENLLNALKDIQNDQNTYNWLDSETLKTYKFIEKKVS